MSDGAPKNPLEMADDEFMNSLPSMVEEVTSDPAEKQVEEEAPATQQAEAEGADDQSLNAGAEGDSEKEDEGKAAEGEADPATKTPEADGQAKAEGEGVGGAKQEEKSAVAPKKEGEAEAPTAFTIPTTFKANGKDIQLRSEDEAVKLMQMGANYTREMQKLAPQRKLLMMLQNNGLDESKLNFLIDLDKKNPDAIKKLIQDAGIDPLDFDASSGNEYLPTDHSVSTQEATFRSTLESLSVEENGKETIAEINTKWDDTSKQAVWQNPELMTIMHEQRASGVYGLISSEIERRVTLGTIPAGTPFLEAYRIVGDELSKEAGGPASEGKDGAESGQNGGGSGQIPANTGPTPVATRAAAPKANVSNDDKAKAASPTRTSPAPAKTAVNFLAMPDEEFMKQMDGRL